MASHHLLPPDTHVYIPAGRLTLAGQDSYLLNCTSFTWRTLCFFKSISFSTGWQPQSRRLWGWLEQVPPTSQIGFVFSPTENA